MNSAHRLDDRKFLTENDPTGMLGLTLDFADQCDRAWSIFREADVAPLDFDPTSVVMTGLGGSAAGGDFVRAVFDDSGNVPFAVNRDYGMPAYVGPQTLVFAVSYSGNTEETLAAYADAKSRGATVVVVSSGGKLTDLARSQGDRTIAVPGGQPPRTAMGYLLVPVLATCAKFGLVPEQDFRSAIESIRAAAAACGPDSPAEANPAKQIAAHMTGKLAMLYAMSGWAFAVAQRWRGQINENAKEMAFTHVMPELCHNEILGWVGSGEQGVSDWVTVVLGDGNESARMRLRAQITFDIIGGATAFHQVKAYGDTVLAKALSLAHVGDYVSLYLASLAGRDPGDMRAIDQLKDDLARHD